MSIAAGAQALTELITFLMEFPTEQFFLRRKAQGALSVREPYTLVQSIDVTPIQCRHWFDLSDATLDQMERTVNDHNQLARDAMQLDTKELPSHLPSGALLALVQGEQELALNASPAVNRVHNQLLRSFKDWDADQRWLIAHMLAGAALNEFDGMTDLDRLESAIALEEFRPLARGANVGCSHGMSWTEWGQDILVNEHSMFAPCPRVAVLQGTGGIYQEKRPICITCALSVARVQKTSFTWTCAERIDQYRCCVESVSYSKECPVHRTRSKRANAMPSADDGHDRTNQEHVAFCKECQG